MTINLVCRGFSTIQNGNSTPNISQQDLKRGIATVGRANAAAVIKGGKPRIMEIIGLFYLVNAYTTELGSGNLQVSRLFLELEQSEKATVSYRLAMACAHLVAQRVLGITWSQHLSFLVKQGTAHLRSGRKQQGDLVGRDASGYWHVVEAKGRSHTIDRFLRSHAKSQAQRVLLVKGKRPLTYCTALTNLARKPIMVEFNDPDPGEDFRDLGGETIVDIELDDLSFTREYYSLIRHLFQELPRQTKEWSINNQVLPFDVVELPFTGTYIGLYQALIPFIELLDWDSLANLSRICEEKLANISEVPRISVGPDGIVVAEQQM